MDETMQHIVEKEQEQVEGQQQIAGGSTAGDIIEEGDVPEPSQSGDHQQEPNEQPSVTSTPAQQNGNTTEYNNSNNEITPSKSSENLKNNSKPNSSAPSTPNINGIAQNGTVVLRTSGNNGVNSDAVVADDLEDLEDDECDDLLNASCKVDGKLSVLHFSSWQCM